MLITCFILLLISNLAHAQQVPGDLIKERLFLRSYQAGVTYYESFANAWLGDTKSDQHLGLNLDELKAMHASHFKKIDALVDSYTSGSDDPKELLDKLDKLSGDIVKIGDSYAAIAKADRLFIASMVDLANGVAENKFFFEHLLKEAQDDETKKSIKEIMASWDDVLATLDKIYGYLYDSSTKRRVMLAAAAKNIRLNLQARYAKATNKELGAVLKQMKGILAATDLLGKLEAYYGDLTVWGLSGRETYYNLYEASLKMTRVGIAGLAKLRQEAIRMDAKGRVGRILNARSKRYLETRRELLAETRAYGWKGFQETQIALAQDTIDNPETYTQQCLDLTKAFITASKKATSFADYAIQEQQWVKVVDVCEGPWKKKGGNR